MMKYTRVERDLPLILSTNYSGVLKWWIYASYAVHPIIQGHTGGGISMGRGFPIVTLINQKLNTLSSAKSYIFVVHDYIPAVCWKRYFMEAQGYQVMEDIFHQDNKSEILLEKNRK